MFNAIKTTTCDKCQRSISNNNYSRHIASCTGDTVSRGKILEEYKLETGMYKCPDCDKSFPKRGLGYHRWRIHGAGKNTHNPNIGFANGTRVQWNTGQTKDTDSRIELAATIAKDRYASGYRQPTGVATYTAEHKSILAKQHKCGGYRPNAGRSKKFRVLDSFGTEVVLQSTYELECSKILNELNISWVRPKALKYNNRNYFADFYLVDYDIYLDPKNNFKATQDRDKIQNVIDQNNVRVYILLKEHLTTTYIKMLVGPAGEGLS